MTPITLVYITGAGRSGGTLLGRLLDQCEGVFYAGELRQLWRPGFERRLCACGAAIGACDFWQAVFQRAWGVLESLDAAWMDAMRLRYTRTRHALRRLPPPGRDPELDRFISELGRLHRAITEVSGCAVLVDSSRTTAYAALLTRIPDLWVRPLHLVRDPRAVVYSWQRQGSGAPAPVAAKLRRKHALLAALEWTVQNVLAERWCARAGGLRLRYEDLVAHPTLALRSILRWIEHEAEPSFVHDDAVHLKPGHSVEGNVYRLSSGAVPLRLDNAWQSGLSPNLRWAATLLCLPGIVRYAYSL